MRRALLLLSLLSGVAHAQWQELPLYWGEIQTVPSSGIASITITTSSPLTGGAAACTTSPCSWTLGLGVVPATLGGMGADVSGSTGFALNTAGTFSFVAGGLVSGLTATRIPYASSATALVDSPLLRASADIVQQSRTTNAQSYYNYGTTDSDSAPTNYERLEFTWVSSVPTIRMVKGGSGTDRTLDLNAPAGVRLQLGGSTKFQIGSSSNFTYSSLFPGSAGLDIGGSGGNEFRSGYFTTSIQGSSTKNLTAASATGVVRIDVASGASSGGTLDYTVEADDGTERQLRAGRVQFAIVNKAGTETCTVAGYDGLTAPDQTKDGSLLAASSSTLTYTWGVDTTPTNGCTLTLNAASGLAETTLRINYRVNLQRTGTITPL